MKALPCRICDTAAHLRWMNHGGAEWWIHCDGCGATGPALPTKPDAGEAWNLQQKEPEQ